MAASRYNVNMCEGPLLGKIVRYVLPLVATYLPQHLFHFADIVVIGRFASHESMAAIGTTGDLNILMLNLIWGIATGANVVVAQCYGAGDRKALTHAVHSAMALAFFFGTLVFSEGRLAGHQLANSIVFKLVVGDAKTGHTDGWRCPERHCDELVHDRDLRVAFIAADDSVRHEEGREGSTLRHRLNSLNVREGKDRLKALIVALGALCFVGRTQLDLALRIGGGANRQEEE